MRYIFTIIFALTICNFSSGQDVNLSNQFAFDGEPFIAINSSNNQHLVVAWMGFQPLNYIVIKTKVSFDGGQTWSATNNIPHTNPTFGSADPALDFDASGNVYLSYIDFNTSIDSGYVYLRKSIDGGLSWGNPVEVINAHSDSGKYPVDRPWLTVDKTGGIHNNNVYITTMNPNIFGYIPPPYNPYFMRSTDGGNSFEPWQYLDSLGWLAGSIITNPYASPTVSTDGTFHAAYASWVIGQNLYPQYILASSSDAGTSFTYNSIADLSTHTAVDDSIAKKGYLLLADPSDVNHIVFLWLLKDFGDSDIFMWESYDSGNTWSNLPIRINDDPIGNNKQQDLLWADFDSDGDLIVSWRDRRNSSDSTFNTQSEIWGACRDKDSTVFSPNFNISSSFSPYDTILANPGNDFMCVKFRDDTLHSVWGDVRSGYLNIWYSKMNVGNHVLNSQIISTEAIIDIQLFPNPSSSVVKLKNIEQLNSYSVTIIDLSGKLLLSRKNESIIDVSNLPNGEYILNVTSEDTQKSFLTKKFIKAQ